MRDRQCSRCNFMVLGDDPGPAITDWICDSCGGQGAAEAPPAPEPALPEPMFEPPPGDNEETMFSPLVEEAPPAPPPPSDAGSACPNCFGLVRVREDKWGKNVLCPLCRRPIHVSETGALEEYDEFAHYLKYKAMENQGLAPRATGVHAMQTPSSPDTETDDEPQTHPVVLFIFAALPLLAGLLPLLLPRVLDKAERMLRKLLPLLTG